MGWYMDDLFWEAEDNVRERLGLNDDAIIDYDLLEQEVIDVTSSRADDAYESWREAQWT